MDLLDHSLVELTIFNRKLVSIKTTMRYDLANCKQIEQQISHNISLNSEIDNVVKKYSPINYFTDTIHNTVELHVPTKTKCIDKKHDP